MLTKVHIKATISQIWEEVLQSAVHLKILYVMQNIALTKKFNNM